MEQHYSISKGRPWNLRSARTTYRFARQDGRGRMYSAWQALRYLCTGCTGRYLVFTA